MLPLGSPIPAPGTSGTLVTTNPFVWTPLTPGTAYTFFVRAKCSPTDFSFYSNGANFYTKPLNDECATPLNVPVNTDMACTLITAGTITGATNSGTPTSTCGGAADDDTWFSFTATSAAHIINFNDIVGSILLAIEFAKPNGFPNALATSLTTDLEAIVPVVIICDTASFPYFCWT